MKSIFTKARPHILAHLIFIIIVCIYYAPLLAGKKQIANDSTQSIGALKESADYGKLSDEKILWSNSMFSGMPVWRGYTSNIVVWFHAATTNTIPPVIIMAYMGFSGVYLLLWVFGANAWVCFMGAIAFAFSSFNIISIEAGHGNKVYDMALMAPVLAGILLAYQKRYWLGGAITALSLSIHIFYGHYQITYYLIFIIAFIALYELIKSIREKTLKPFIIASVFLIASSLIAILPNLSQLWTTQVYSKNTQRAGSELTLPKENDKSKKADKDAEEGESNGLDKSYTFAWSNSISETFTLFVPYFYGGSSNEQLSQSSDTYKALIDNNVPRADAKSFIKNIPLYWGDQPFTSGPVYFGAIICFLFVLGLFLVKDGFKWWIIASTVLSIVLSWGDNFELFSDIFYYYFPLYNKFRSVTMILCIAQLMFPLLACIVLKKIISGEVSEADFLKGLKWSTIICGGTALLLTLLGGALFDFSSTNDEQLKQQFPEWLMDAIRMDRANKLRSDAFRTLFFVLVAAGLLWAFVKEKINPILFYILLSGLIIVDLVLVDVRYLNYSAYFPAKNYDTQVFNMTPEDEMILQDKDLYYRVANFTKSIFNDATTSYYHKSVGGYSAIKLARYQDLIEYQLGRNNIAVYSMLNTKYFIISDQKNNRSFVQKNPDAAGNAWFVKEYKLLSTANDEMKALDSIIPKKTAYINTQFADQLNGLTIVPDSSATISLSTYHPNRLSYKSKAASEQLAVFSEIYYQPGWNAYIDGKPTPHFRTDYTLRGLRVPAGEHTIDFKFEPQHYFIGEKISFVGSILLVLFCIGAPVIHYLRSRKTA